MQRFAKKLISRTAWAPPTYHWRVAQWRDIGGGIRDEKPAKPACMLSDQPIAEVVTFLVPQHKRVDRYVGQKHPVGSKLRDLLTCEACLIMFDGMTEQ